MKDKLFLVRIDPEYCNYLRKFDSKVPYNFDKKEPRPFVGVLFSVGECMYFAPLSSPKPKHLKLNPKLDFLKLDNGRLGAVNFNNMLPVTDANVTKIELNYQGLTKLELNYNKLLKKQIYWLNRHSDLLYGRSKKLYDKYLDGSLKYNIAKRCCNFKLLEEKCQEYNKVKN